MITFEKLRFKNILSYGNNFTEIDFTDNKLNLISSKNGAGKCLDKNTEIDIIIEDPEILKLFNDM